MEASMNIDKPAGQGKNSQQHDLYQQTIRMEDNINVAQRFVTFQRSEAQLAVADALTASLLVERESIERNSMDKENAAIEAARRTRKEIKNFLVQIVNQLKDKQVEVKHLKEAAATATALRVNLKNKRESYQILAKQLENREKTEKERLREFHERTAKNLIIWQELEIRELSKDERDRVRPMNKVKAQQLREVQQKEAEQLRELQHLKAKFNLDQFNVEMEFVEKFEMNKAQQLIELQTLERQQKLQKQELKRRINDLREEARNIKEQEINQVKREQVFEDQQRRARELVESQKSFRIERERAFEAEQAAKEKDLIDALATASDSESQGTKEKDNDSASKGRSFGSRSVDSDPEDDIDKDVTQQKQRQDQQDEANLAEISRRQDLHKTQAQAAMNQAIEALSLQKRQHQEDREKVIEDQTRMNKNMNDDFESLKARYRKDNEQKTVELISTHAKEKADILEAQAREMDAVQKSIELEKQLHSRSLNETQVASQAKSEFLSFVCHELRNPLSGIVAIVDMLLGNKHDMKLSKDQRMHIDTIKHESELMCAIVNDVLDFAKIEANMLVLDLSKMDLHSTLQELVMEQRLIAKRTKPDVDVLADIQDVPRHIVSDSVRLRQVLLNLMSNAIKFTFQGSITVRVSISGTNADRNKVVLLFEVIDTGVGISAEDQEHVFSAFSQANPSTTREFGGTGLGLSISRALIERMGGTIGLESTKGVGTKFYFTITAEVVDASTESVTKTSSGEGEQGSAEAAKADSTLPKDITVLVVEDSSTLRRLWAKLLKEQKCIVETASNGADAIEKCSEKLYDVVLMDITMPIMSGDVAVRKLRESGYPGVVIALTANAMESDKVHYMEVGMNAVVTKPFKMSELCSTINEQLKKNAKSPIKKEQQ